MMVWVYMVHECTWCFNIFPPYEFQDIACKGWGFWLGSAASPCISILVNFVSRNLGSQMRSSKYRYFFVQIRYGKITAWIDTQLTASLNLFASQSSGNRVTVSIRLQAFTVMRWAQQSPRMEKAWENLQISIKHYCTAHALDYWLMEAFMLGRRKNIQNPIGSCAPSLNSL